MKRGLLVLFIGLVISTSAFAQTNTWDGSSNNNWNTAANWSLNLVPTSAHDVVININASIVVDISSTINSLTINGSATVLLICGTADATITIDNVGSTIILGSSLSLLGANGSGTRSMGLAFAGANQTISISGTLNVTNTGEGSIYNATNSITTVTGTINSTGGAITSTSTNLSFNSGGKYTHAYNGGTIPTATWNVASTCNITGITSTAPGGLTQSFGNFTWDCAGHNNLISLNSQLTTVNGDFTVKYAGQIQGNRTQNGLALSTNANLTLNVGGNFNVDHYSTEATWLMLTIGSANVTVNITGNFNMSLTGSGTCFFDYYVGTTLNSLVLNITGNFNQTGGYFDWTFFPSAAGSNYAVMNLYGNFSQTGTSLMITSTTDAGTPNGKIYFKKAGTQTIYASTPANVSYTNFDVQSGATLEMLSSLYLYSDANAPWAGQFVVNSGGILDAGTYQLLSSTGSVAGTNNSFTLNSGAGIITANTNGVQNTTLGTISTSIATRTYSSGANYTYDGIALQNSGIFTTTPTANQVNNLTINNTTGVNTTGVTLQQEFKVASTCTFINGVFTTTNTNVLTINNNATIVGADLGVSSNKYVNGPLKKVGNQAFTFPVGKASHGCRPVYISAPVNTTDEFRAELIRGNAGSLGPVTAVGLARVSGCEYWYIDRLVGSSNVNLTLSWSGESPCNAQSYVTDLPNLVVAHFNNTSWDSYGSNGYAGNAVSGTVTWNYTGPYNVTPIHTPWSLGSLVWYENPLTVKFVNLRASEKDGQVKVEWANIAETGVDKYFVEYSTDGRSFDELKNTTARKNDGERTDYSWWHMTPTSGANYYRIKAIEFTGAVTYSQVVRLDLNKNNSDLIVYPNPVKGNNINIAASGLAAGKYDIIVLNMSGQKIIQRSLDHAGGSISMQVDLPETIKAGLYSIKLSGSEKTLVKTFIVQ